MSFQNAISDTMRVEVFYFKVYDFINDRMAVPLNNGRRSKRTAYNIREIGGVIEEDSREVVEASHLDEDGRYYPTEE